MDVLSLPALPFAAPRGELIRGLDVDNAWRRFAPMVRRRCARLLSGDAEAKAATREVFGSSVSGVRKRRRTLRARVPSQPEVV